MLLDAGADVNTRGEYSNALQAASYYGDERVVSGIFGFPLYLLQSQNGEEFPNTESRL